MEKTRNKTWGKWDVIGILFLTAWVPIFLIFPYLENIAYFISANKSEILEIIINLFSLLVGIYLILRFLIAFTTNKFLPGIPLPNNKTRYVVLSLIGVLIAIFSSTITLIVWLVASLIGMKTFGFTSNGERNKA